MTAQDRAAEIAYLIEDLNNPNIRPEAIPWLRQKAAEVLQELLAALTAAREEGKREGWEEAAKICDEPIRGIGMDDPRSWASPDHAAAIRSLAKAAK